MISRKRLPKTFKILCGTVRDNPFGIYAVDGSVLDGEALHPVAIIAVDIGSGDKYVKA